MKTLLERLKRQKKHLADKLAWEIAFRLPETLVLYCYVRVIAHATQMTNLHPDEVTYDIGCKTWTTRIKA